MYLSALILHLPHKDTASPVGDAFVALRGEDCCRRENAQQLRFRRGAKALMIRLVMTDASRSAELADKAFFFWKIQAPFAR